MATATLSPLFTWRSAIVETDLSPTTKLVALCLSMHMSERGDSCFPSYETLAAETSLSRVSVIRHVAKLVDAGLLKKRPGHGRGHSNRYSAAVPEKVSEGYPFTKKVSPATVKGITSDTLGRQEDVNARTNVLAQAPNQEELQALWETCEREVRKAPTARSPRAAYAKLVREMLDAGWTPERVVEAAALYRKHPMLGRTMLTVASLAKWGDELVSASSTEAMDAHAAEIERLHPDWFEPVGSASAAQ